MTTYTEEMIKVMQAFEEGKEIETRIRAGQCKGVPQPWCVAHTPAWDWAHQEYRVKEPERRMTYRELAEWLVRGKGQWKFREGNLCCSTIISYSQDMDNYEVPFSYTIRYWNSETWLTPTKEIFQRDCR